MTQNVYGPATRTACSKPATVMRSKTVTVELFMAGDVEHAKQVIRRFCRDVPCCVTVTATTFIYRGGEESGFVVGLRNYPRFSSIAGELWDRASALGLALREELGQDSYMISEHGGGTEWNTTRHGG